MSDLIDRNQALNAINISFSLSGAWMNVAQLPSAPSRMTCDGCKYANHQPGWSDVCVLCIRNFRNFKDRYER